MKNYFAPFVSLHKIALCSAALCVMLIGTPALAQTKKAPTVGGPAIQGAERALKKKLTTTQKTAIISAAKARNKANDDARKKNNKEFRLKLAKIVGLSLPQLEAKEKAARKK